MVCIQHIIYIYRLTRPPTSNSKPNVDVEDFCLGLCHVPFRIHRIHNYCIFVASINPLWTSNRHSKNRSLRRRWSDLIRHGLRLSLCGYSCACYPRIESRLTPIHPRNLLFDVFLVVFLAAVKVRGLLNRDVLSQSTALLTGQLRQLLLIVGMYKDGRPVLSPSPARIGRGVDRKEILEELLVGPLVAIKRDPDRLGIVLDVPIGGVLVGRSVGIARRAARVADDRFEDALLAIVIALRTPESSHGRLEGRVDVLGRGQEWADFLRLGFLGGEHVVVVLCHLVVSMNVVESGRTRSHTSNRRKGFACRNPRRCCQQSGGKYQGRALHRSVVSNQTEGR